MVSAEVNAVITEEVRIAITAETQRMSKILEDVLGQASKTIETNMKVADETISAKLAQSESVSAAVL